MTTRLRALLACVALLVLGMLILVLKFSGGDHPTPKMIAANASNGGSTSFPARVIDFEPYDSVDSVLDQSDTVVIGTVGTTVSRQIDDGGFPNEPENGNPVILQEVLIKEVLRNDSLRSGDTIVLVSFDNSRMKIDEQRPLKMGDEIVLLAVQLPRERSPGIRKFHTVYGRIGADSSIYDLHRDGVLSARDANIVGPFTLTGLRDLVRSIPPKALIWGSVK